MEQAAFTEPLKFEEPALTLPQAPILAFMCVCLGGIANGRTPQLYVYNRKNYREISCQEQTRLFLRTGLLVTDLKLV